jgi:hypothetical protein
MLIWLYNLNRPLTALPSLHIAHSLCTGYFLRKNFSQMDLAVDVYRGFDFNLDAVRKASLYSGCGHRRSVGRYRLPGY